MSKFVTIFKMFPNVTASSIFVNITELYWNSLNLSATSYKFLVVPVELNTRYVSSTFAAVRNSLVFSSWSIFF